MSEWRDLPPPPDPDQPGWDPDPDLEPEPSGGVDPVGVLAVGIGLVGIVFLGIVLALVAGVVGAIAGQRARESGRSVELAYLAFLLAAVDGVVWIALHYLFNLPIEAG